MAITSTVSRKFADGYVQVEIGSKKQEPVYYKVPENKADEFQKEYKKNSKKMPWISTGVMFGTIIATIVPTHFLTKNIQSSALRNTIGILVGIIGGIGSMLWGMEIEANSHKKLLSKYNAEEIDYTNSKLPID